MYLSKCIKPCSNFDVGTATIVSWFIRAMTDWLDSLANESIVEDVVLAWLESFGYSIKHGPEIAPGEPASERAVEAAT